ncbi:MAG TPA: MMPL family transporter [Candidatus Thalassarchaeaceae archaeon]|jgi:RND superfamily putative drug exporter|nr:MAG TPA: MMPL family transporter [Candidatus Poseidoniales archaeon]HII34419.1 MMPL family transporter [Candidatus Thalassarchaeaceae archaeon]
MEGATEPEALQHRAYYKMGLIVYDNAKVVLLLTLILCGSLASLMTLEPRYAEGYGEGDLESVHGWDAARAGFTSENESDSFSFHVLFHHPDASHEDEAIQSAMMETVFPMAQSEHVSIEYPWFTNEINRTELVSSVNPEWTRVKIEVNLDRDGSKALLKEHFDDLVLPDDAPEGMEKWVTDNLAIDVTFDLTLKDELIQAELLAAPLTLIILLLVFGSLVAAGLPVLSGVYTVLAAVGIVTGLSYVFDDITVYANNIVSLLGIGLSVDYSLFIVNRFREELGRGRDHRTAIAMTSATAGRAIFFSGMTVIVGLMGMLFFENTGLPSLGWGGICATAVALTSSIVLLPAILSLLGEKVNSFKVPFSFGVDAGEEGFWSNIASGVMKRPFAVLVPAVVVLMLAGSPFLQAEYGITTYKALSPDDESRQGMELTDENWPEYISNTALAVFETEEGVDPLDENNIRSLYRFSQEILSIEGTSYVRSHGHFDVNMSENDVVDFWDSSKDGDLSPMEVMLVSAQREYLNESFIGNGVVLLVVGIEGDESSVSSREVVLSIRDLETKNDQFGGSTTVNVAGVAAYNQDVIEAVAENLPISLAFILITSYILIFLQVRSVVLPLKALVMNVLSVSASFGVLVWIFQMGNGAELLNFTPQPIDPTTPVMIFAILFGLSMDYEVLMLSRIHEEWERTGDNTKSVAVGLQKSGRIITSAALVMVAVFSAFGLSSVSLMKQFGFMLALGVAVDATLVRALVVPSTMRLMGDLNWYAPSWLVSSNEKTESTGPSEQDA